MVKKAKKANVAKKKSAKKSARRRFCFLITADPNFVERCEFGPDGRCNLNCTIIPASEVPGSARVRER
jgi:hypothetical protein